MLAAPDRDELIEWLRNQPLLHAEGHLAMVHAGLLPEWSVERAKALAGEVEGWLRGPDYRQLLARMYGDEPNAWSEALTGMDRLRVIINAMTRLRVCDRSGSMVLKFKSDPGDATEGMTPWFDMPQRASADHTMVIGHWSALGVRIRPDLLALDSGCVWAARLPGLAGGSPDIRGELRPASSRSRLATAACAAAATSRRPRPAVSIGGANARFATIPRWRITSPSDCMKVRSPTYAMATAERAVRMFVADRAGMDARSDSRRRIRIATSGT